ncbi:MAG: hypothetical protein C0507_22680 [Cyanobacteria bacterium PR.3.49]|jgi:tetratricopeptide (TPR) repeat protein|nr:hypothetical protein [Cyanobacteria bacterium PR.3.49]
MLTQDQLQEAIRHSKGKRLQIGQILVMCGFLTPRDLQSVLQAQSMIRDKSIDFNLAIRCLKIAFKMGSTFGEVLDNHEDAPARKAPTGRLGELLLEAGVLKYEQLSKAMEQSLQTGLPLGRMLVLHQVLTDAVLNAVLDIQVRLRDEMLSREEAVSAVRLAAGLPSSASSDNGSVEKPAQDAPRRRGIRLGELLVLSGVLTENDVMNALEWGLVNQQSIGQVLISRSLLSAELLEAALKLQKSVDESQLDALNAAECLGQIHESKISLEEALESAKVERPDFKPSLSYEKLLTLARVVNQEDIQAAFDLSSKSPQIVGKVLVLTGYSDAPTVQATLRCYQLLAKGWISQDDAVAALDYCLHHRQNKKINFDMAVKELGWSPNKRLRMDGEAAAIPELVSDSPSLPTVEDELESAIPVNQVEESKENEGKKRKFTETILPEDAKAMQLANLVKAGIAGKKPDADEEEEEASDQKTALANAFVRLAQSYCDQGNYVEAQQVYERILVNRLNELGTNNVELTTDLTNLAAVLCVQGKFNQAEPFMRRAVWVLENAEIPAPLRLADALSMLGEIYFRQDKFVEAEIPVTKSLHLRQGNLPVDHTDIADSLSSQAKLFRKTGRVAEAEKVYAKAQQILSRKQDQAPVSS